ncbi:MAG: GH92 family glycosyl hydrolase [Deltaproteobacteria bacterium]|nr:GH92 family glycosyl hydrolase [Deltaproteobacteria bacterium]
MSTDTTPPRRPHRPSWWHMMVSAVFVSGSALGCRPASPGSPAQARVTPPAAVPFDPTPEVDPFIGTAAHGHTFPGATQPFGMVQLSPDTRLTGWDGCSGYHYDDTILYGFSHTHLSGTGIADYADILLMPLVDGAGPSAIGDADHPHAARFDHADESAGPGWYSVRLEQPAVAVELTTTPRVGIHRYTFDDPEHAAVLLDLRHRDEVLESWVEQVSPTELVGLRRSRSWARDQRVFFAARLSRPLRSITSIGAVETDPSRPRWSGDDVRLQLTPESGEQPLLVKVALSAVDTDGARANLDAEAQHWDFDVYRGQAREAWRQALAAVEIEGGTPSQRRVFYTALYHSMIAPNLWEDVDGRYRGMDQRVHESPGFTAYSVFSLWDTFRATHPLLTILDPTRTRDFVQTLVSQAQWGGGDLPMWELAANYTGTMIGYHAVPVIVDAWVKGIRDFDVERALEFSIATADAEKLGLPGYRAHGYVPAEQEHESVSKTLEYAYDDWCIAQLADGLGNTTERDRFARRAQSWSNLFDPQSGLFRARDNGGWVPDFEPREVNVHYTEANAWQYGFFVPHDVGGLIERHGSPAKLAARLDQLFQEPSALVGRQQVDITGLIGQYAHGNEPSHHAAYLYPYVGQAPSTQARVRQILDTLYADTPDGLTGNDDCGQLSSWYVLSALGFYPLAPGRDDYVIGSPLFPRTTIHLPGGGAFVIEAPGVAADAPYVQRATLDGEPREQARLRHHEIVDGGHLVLQMGPEPNPGWGAIEPDPPQWDGATAQLPTPIVHAPGRGFTDTMTIELSLPLGDAEVRYALDGKPPTGDSPRYVEPLVIRETTTVTAAAFQDGRRGPWATATFHRRQADRSVTLNTEPHRSYRAGGPDGLIDGRRGTERWRTGGWQGYHGVDFEAVIDLGKVQAVQRVSAAFLQDVRSWIWMPLRMEVEVSRDGKRWKALGPAATHTVPERGDRHIFVQPLEVRGRSRARYVRVRAPQYGTIPQWHLGSGNPSFVFVDEVVVD